MIQKNKQTIKWKWDIKSLTNEYNSTIYTANHTNKRCIQKQKSLTQSFSHYSVAYISNHSTELTQHACDTHSTLTQNIESKIK